jgi:hypothetical protein
MTGAALAHVAICDECAVESLRTSAATVVAGTDETGRLACAHLARRISRPSEGGDVRYYADIARAVDDVEDCESGSLTAFLLGQASQAAMATGYSADHFLVLAKAAYDAQAEDELPPSSRD